MSFVIFWNKYKPAIVLVPTLAALHYGWFWFQDRYAQDETQKITEQPIVTVRFQFIASSIRTHSSCCLNKFHLFIISHHFASAGIKEIIPEHR